MQKTFSGKPAILVLLALGLVAAVGATWYRAWVQRRPMELWGRLAAQLVLRAPEVELLELSATGTSTEPTHERLIYGGQRLTVVRRQDVSSEPDLLYVRRSLVNEASFDWSTSAADCQPVWKYALRFTDEGANQATVLLAPNCKLAQMAETGASQSIAPVMSGINRFIEERFAAAPKAEKPKAAEKAP
jgi:hypothetical protein